MMYLKWMYRAILIVFLLSGCTGGGAASVYYTLHSACGMAHQNQDQRLASLTLGLGPVVLPDYLDRNVIVTRVSPNRLAVNDGHRWAGTLQSEILRVMAANLERCGGVKAVVTFPWTMQVEPDVRLHVEIQTLEGALGENVTLKAAWSLTSAHSDQPAVHRVSKIQEEVGGGKVEDMVAAMGSALATLSREMADSVPMVVP